MYFAKNRIKSQPFALWISLLGLLLLGCPDSETGADDLLDMELGPSLDAALDSSIEEADQQLFQTRQLSLLCAMEDEACDESQSQIEVRTDSEIRLGVQLTQNGRPEAGTLVTFAFLDVMGTDVQGLSLEGSELQVRSVSTDYRGLAEVTLMTGLVEADLSLRAFVIGVGQVEWDVQVRRDRVGRLEIQTEYQPGSQNRGAQSFDAVDVYLLPDTFSEAACENIGFDPSSLTIHAVRESSGIFEVTAERFESVVTFDSTDSEKVFLAVATVRNRSGETIGFGCLGGISVESESTVRFKLTIQDIVIPLDYKGEYRVRLLMDMSDLLREDLTSLSPDDERRLSFLSLFQEFRTDLYDFKTGTRDRARILMDIFCNYIPFEGEECSQIESYIVRGLLEPLVEDIIVPQAPLFLDALEDIADVLRLLHRVEIDGIMNIRNRNPDSFGFLRENSLRFRTLKFGWGSDCNTASGMPQDCETRTTDTQVVHLDESGAYFSLTSLFDADSDGTKLSIAYYEMEIFFGLIMTRLLETWVFPQTLNAAPDGNLLDALVSALPCTPIDQFVGDEPFCLPFLLTNLEFVIRTMFAEFSFGGRKLGFSGDAEIVDLNGDRIVDQFVNGRLDTYLPAVSVDDSATADSPSAMDMLSVEAELESRKSPLIKICFSACRCLSDLCECEPQTCDL